MTLIKSISGIRGTIGGKAGDTLNPLDIVKFTSAYATLIRRTTKVQSNKIVVGRDARISGPMVKNVVCGTLMGMGFDVVNIGLATTPTTEIAVTMEGACGGIIITASHNPRMWNALKLLNEKGHGGEIAVEGPHTFDEFGGIAHIGETFMSSDTNQIMGVKLFADDFRLQRDRRNLDRLIADRTKPVQRFVQIAFGLAIVAQVE